MMRLSDQQKIEYYIQLNNEAEYTYQLKGVNTTAYNYIIRWRRDLIKKKPNKTPIRKSLEERTLKHARYMYMNEVAEYTHRLEFIDPAAYSYICYKRKDLYKASYNKHYTLEYLHETLNKYTDYKTYRKENHLLHRNFFYNKKDYKELLIKHFNLADDYFVNKNLSKVDKLKLLRNSLNNFYYKYDSDYEKFKECSYKEYKLLMANKII